MPKTLEITVPSERTEGLLSAFRQSEGVIGTRVQRGISLQPPGDVITLQVTNRALQPLLRHLEAEGVGRDAATSFSTSEPTSIVSSSARDRIADDTSNAAWEEMALLIAKDSNMTPYALGLMALSGMVAVIGISTNALHVVIAAMIVAPGFEPFVRVSLGLVARSRRVMLKGVTSAAKAYTGLAVGALLAVLLLRVLGYEPIPGQSAYLPAGSLVSYWSTITVPSLIVSLMASVAGAILVATYRRVLTAGVMVALALIPGTVLGVMALVAGDWTTAGTALLRWLIDAALVTSASVGVFALHQRFVEQRPMLP